MLIQLTDPGEQEKRKPIVTAYNTGVINKDAFSLIQEHWAIDDVHARLDDLEKLIAVINQTGRYKIEATRTKLD